MQSRVVVELSFAADAVQLHEVHAGGSAMTGRTAAALGLTLAEAKLVLAGLQRRLVQAQIEQHCQARRSASDAVRTVVANGTLDQDHFVAERWARRPFRRAA